MLLRWWAEGRILSMDWSGLLVQHIINCSIIYLLQLFKCHDTNIMMFYMQVAPTLVPLLKFYFHEEVRKAAVSGIELMMHISFPLVPVVGNTHWNLWISSPAMPELLRSAKLAIEKGLAQGRNESYVKQLSDYIIPALVEALHKVTCVSFHLSSVCRTVHL